MLKIPRHLFVSEALRDQAYGDYPLPIGEQQTISQPYIVAEMTQALQLGPNDRVLEIGTVSGYQAAVLSLKRLAALIPPPLLAELPEIVLDLMVTTEPSRPPA